MSDVYKNFLLICLRCGNTRKGRCNAPARITKRFCTKCNCDTNHNLRPDDSTKSNVIKFPEHVRD